MRGMLVLGGEWRAIGTGLRGPARWQREFRRIDVRRLYLVLIVAFTALVLLFKVQNLETATVSLFSASVTLPMSVLLFGVYVLGMLTGGFLYALLRSWVRNARLPG
jgi:putative membrane protein